MFYFYTFIYSLISCFKNEFPSSAEHKRYFEEGRKPNSCWSTVTSIVFFPPYFQSQCGPATVWLPRFFKIYSYWCECMWCCTVYWYGGARTAADRMCTVARYYDISSKADRGDIFIRASAGQMGAPSRILLLCPLPQILWKFKKHHTIGVKIEL